MYKSISNNSISNNIVSVIMETISSGVNTRVSVGGVMDRQLELVSATKLSR